MIKGDYMKDVSNKITRFQYMFIIQASMIGLGILSLPSSVCDVAQQSGWIPTLLSGVYPLFITFVGYIIHRNAKFLDFVQLNNKLYGKILSYVICFVFFVYFLLQGSLVTAGFANVLNFSTTKFLSPYSIIIITILLTFLSTNEGLTNIGRLAEFLFPLTVLLIILPLYFINRGDSTNLLPIISDYKLILKAMPDTFFSYSGVEICFFIFPFLTSKKKINIFSAIGSLITITLYTIVVFITIYYCGFNLTSKLQYPLLYLIASSEIPVLSNFEPLFIFLWGAKIFLTVSISGFIVTYIFSQVTKIPYYKSCIVSFGLIFLLSLFFVPDYNRTFFAGLLIPIMFIFVFLWSLISLLLSFIRKGVSK
ncbi:GerAB/ArcD/ProY family transporter [Fervidicella metallireducens]|nr:GerAB/ArcD/ProY family transporter [Fervidicella metallireducens]